MVIGTDISHWEDNPNTPQKIDFQKMKAAGAEFCIFKASQSWWTDLVFRISWNDCKGVMPRGAYHYLDWSKPGIKQAEYFCDVIKDDPPELPPIVDYECRKNVPLDANGHLWNFLTYVEKVTGRIPIIYTSPDYWKNYGSSNSGWAKYPLWIANYNVMKPYIPRPWNKWLLWQYTDKGDGKLFGAEALGIDLNYFNGTKEELSALCGVTSPVVLTLEQKVNLLYEQAKQHGWTIP